jgi:hypothetical protein
MMDAPERDAAQTEEAIASARLHFRQALLNSQQVRTNVGEVEAAAARYCRTLRDAGYSPQSMLIDAKKVIEDAIDGENVPVAERAVTSCIQHYFRPEDGPST